MNYKTAAVLSILLAFLGFYAGVGIGFYLGRQITDFEIGNTATKICIKTPMK